LAAEEMRATEPLSKTTVNLPSGSSSLFSPSKNSEKLMTREA
jgi:hypothetical protein